MLQQFTWQQFLIASMVLSLIWYGGVILMFYRTELVNVLNRKPSIPSVEKLPHRWDKDVEVLVNENNEIDDLMGKAKLPDGMASVGMGSFGFTTDENEREEQVGLISDLLQELKGIFSLLEREDGRKTDFFNLMEMVREKFPKIGSHPRIPQINEFISEHAPFHLSQEELENLWD